MNRRSFFQTLGLSSLVLPLAPKLFLPRLIKPAWRPPNLPPSRFCLQCEEIVWQQPRMETVYDENGNDRARILFPPTRLVGTAFVPKEGIRIPNRGEIVQLQVLNRKPADCFVFDSYLTCDIWGQAKLKVLGVTL